MPSPVRPGRVAALTVLTSLVAATPAAAVPGPGARYRDQLFNEVFVERDITFGQALAPDGQPQTLQLDLYRPVGDRERRRRALVWVHGGGFTGGDKAGGFDVRVARRFAEKGYVVVSINYRLGGRAAGFDYLRAAQNDAQAAVRWLRLNALNRGVRIDRRAISIAGASAGAITALRVAYNSEDPGTSGSPGPSSRVSAAVSDAGAPLGLDVDPGEPRALELHGTADTILPYSLGQAVETTIRAGGVPVRLVTFPGVGHTPLATRFDQAEPFMSRFLFRNGGRITGPLRGSGGGA